MNWWKIILFVLSTLIAIGGLYLTKPERQVLAKTLIFLIIITTIVGIILEIVDTQEHKQEQKKAETAYKKIDEQHSVIMEKDKRIVELEKKQHLLTQQELLIKDLKVIAQYIFSLKSNTIEKGGRSMGLSVTGGFVNTSSEPKDILRMYTDYKFDLNYPDKKTAELILEFIPKDSNQIINEPISFLEKYNRFVLPYESICRDFVKTDIGSRIKLHLQIIINGKLIIETAESIDVPLNTKVLNFEPKEKLFKDIENKYLKKVTKE